MISNDYQFSAFRSENIFCDDGFFSFSSTEQKRVEDVVDEAYKDYLAYRLDDVDDGSPYVPSLTRELHVEYIKSILNGDSRIPVKSQSNQIWYCYWGVHSLRLLEAELEDSLASSLVKLIKECEYSTGGYGASPGFYPHLAASYAAVMALVSIGTEEALASINRKSLYDFLMSMKLKDGSFQIQCDGEIDTRGTYCALAVASLTGILSEELILDTSTWLSRCENYEGGFGASNYCEAHGGYTFCGVAALLILDKGCLISSGSVLKWLVNRQMKFEGGFQGRTNKLVDSCYSFWVFAVFPLLEAVSINEIKSCFDGKALQEYVLVACQDRVSGGFKDRPDSKSDLYHTCYSLSGLSIAQHCSNGEIVGGFRSQLARISPIFNVCEVYVKRAQDYFSKMLPLNV